MILPATGDISQGFSLAHQAVDIADDFRTPIKAPVAGRVSAVGQMGTGTNDAGLVVQIGDTTNGHRLCHLDSFTVKVGDQVKEGQIVGYMGFTGYTRPDNVVQGTHLHWIMWVNGKRVDGRKYLTKESDVADIATLEKCRIYLALVQGKNGHYDKKNALAGDMDADIHKYFSGRKDDDVFWEIYNSKEARDYRERYLPSAQKALEQGGIKPTRDTVVKYINENLK